MNTLYVSFSPLGLLASCGKIVKIATNVHKLTSNDRHDDTTNTTLSSTNIIVCKIKDLTSIMVLGNFYQSE